MCSKFGKIKIQESETLINSKFKSIKWKLFNELISQEDGAPKVSECCIPTYIGIDFVGASTSRSIKIGLEIIKVLSEYYNIRMPVFIDNCESISEIPVIESQMIQLRVSPQDKQMRSEVGGWYE